VFVAWGEMVWIWPMKVSCGEHVSKMFSKEWEVEGKN